MQQVYKALNVALGLWLACVPRAQHTHLSAEFKNENDSKLMSPPWPSLFNKTSQGIGLPLVVLEELFYHFWDFANFLATLYFVPYLYAGRSPPYK